MVLDSIRNERFNEKDLEERTTPENDMEFSVSVPKSPPQSQPMDLSAIPAVTSSAKTKMASPSMPQYPAAPTSNHANGLEATLSPRNATNTHLSANSFSSQSTNYMGDVEGCNEDTANARTRDSPCNLINKSAVMLPSVPPNGKKSPTSLPGNNSPSTLALFDRNSLPSVPANATQTAASEDLKTTSKVDRKESLTPTHASESTLRAASLAKSSMGLVLTCHDRLETALTPTNIIEYKSMDGFANPASARNDKVCKSVDVLSKQNGSRSTHQNDVEYSSGKGRINEQSIQSGVLNSQSPSKPNSDQILAGSKDKDTVISLDRMDSSDMPLMTQTNMAAATSVTKGTKDLDPIPNIDVGVAPMDKYTLDSTARPDRLDLLPSSTATSTSGAKRKSEPLSKSASKSPSCDKLPSRHSGAALSVSQNRIKSDHLAAKRNVDSPTKPKIIAKSPSRDKTEKKLFRYTIGAFPGSPQTKIEDGGALVLPSKPKTVTKSPSTDKTDKRLNRSITEMSTMPQNKMVERASAPKTNMASPTKLRTASRSPSVNNIDKSASDSSKTKMADVASLPQPTSTSPTKPKTLTKSPSVDKTASKKPLRKEKSCPAEPSSERRPSLRPPWCGGAWTPSRSQSSLSLAQSGFIRRSESSMSVNAGLRSRAGVIRPATSLPHIPKASSARPCLLVALRPTNLQQERERFFQSEFTYEPQFEYDEAELSTVLDKYSEASDLFLQQAVGIMECVLGKYGSYENFEEVTGGNVLPKSQVWAAVRKYLQKEGCVGEVVVRLSDELLSQAVMVVENCRPTLTINLSGARQHWLEGMLRHEIGTHYLRLVNNNLQPWASSERRKALGLKGANPTEEGLASLHSVLLRKQPHLWRAALLYYTVHHAAAMSFSQLFHHIRRFVQSPDVRWEYCLRAKRGQTDTSRPGCFSKDQVYLDGILRILRHRRAIDFQLLTALGKVSFEDMERLRPLAALSRTRIPHFMMDTDRYQAQLDHILVSNELSDEELQQLLP